MNVHSVPEGSRGAHESLPLGDWLAMFDAVHQCLSDTAHAKLDSSQHDLQDRAGGHSAPDLCAVMQGCAGALRQLRGCIGDVLPPNAASDSESILRAQVARLRASLVAAQAAERRASHRASHDELTALPNRAFFTERLQAALASTSTGPRPLAVLFIDLDQFKPVNDLHGHGTGDELLRIVAQRLRRTMRAQDVVSRFGGDEFACMLPGLEDVQQIARIAVDMRAAVAVPLRLVGGVRVRTCASIGVARAPHDGTRCDALIQHADAAMYRAKRDGSGLAF